MKIAAVIVTYNRIGHLRKTLKRYSNQTYNPSYIIVVDNNSTDGTVDYLKKWENTEENIIKKVIYLTENVGGSGGFYIGLKASLCYKDAEWIWVADDDAYPALNAFENVEKVIESHKNDIEEISAICGVCGGDGRYSNVQRHYLKKNIFGIQELPIPSEWYRKNTEFDIDLYSFVGTIMKRENLLKAGLPRKDFFIYQDDLEHAIRMRKTGRIICNKSIRILHRDNLAPIEETSWRDYYANRNIVVMYKEHFGLWSLFWRIIRRMLVVIFIGRKWSKIKISIIGIKDGLKENMGIHSKYKPT